ncbi:DUF6221 family protein [Nocardia sp. CA-290969]|uniref:DUF6221 family protein n=1 Tax=Nocardia sp. CA-290969 TaxID=3239986 RepID=UPI003D8D3333
MNIEEFIKARLDEDEEIARAASAVDVEGPSWRVRKLDHHGMAVFGDHQSAPPDGRLGFHEDAQTDHIARHDPARVLRDVAGKRRMLALATEVARSGAEFADQDFATLTGALAEPYADHPDYQQEWNR